MNASKYAQALLRSVPQKVSPNIVPKAWPDFSTYVGSPQEAGLLQYHRDNLRNKTFLESDNSTLPPISARHPKVSTVYITGISGPDGRIYNVPGYFEGALHNERETAEYWRENGGLERFPSYSSGAEANAAAQRMHRIIEADMAAYNAQKKPSFSWGA